MPGAAALDKERRPGTGARRPAARKRPPIDPANPLGLAGFAFCELTSPDPAALAALLGQLGFVRSHRHPRRAIARWRQGRIDLLVNEEEEGHAADYRRAHGPSVCGMALRVADAAAAFRTALARGGAAADGGALGPGGHALRGIGGSLLYLVDAPDPFAGWTPITGAGEARNGVGLDLLDHLAQNVGRGRMNRWTGFYRELFGFAEQTYFDIKGRATGFSSQAMVAPDGAIRIPLNESRDEHSQIEQFIREHRGEGIQHLAFTTDDIHATVETLRARGVRLQDTASAYYDGLDARVPGHGEDVARLRANGILVDGDAGGEGTLLQIFTEPALGPVFFEIIQRKGNQGFGNGNVQALFESVERDQIRRGQIRIDA